MWSKLACGPRAESRPFMKADGDNRIEETAMRRHHFRTAAALAALVLALPPAAPARQGAGDSIAAGMLTCDLTGDTNLVILSSERFDCTFRGAGGSAQRGGIPRNHRKTIR